MKKTVTSLLLTGLLSSSFIAMTPTISAQETGGQYVTYSVANGDTLYHIARVFGTSVGALMDDNGLIGTIIFPGQELIIPPTGKGYLVQDNSYVVQAGDTLYAIARATGTTVAALQAQNHLTHAYIYPGQVLQMPTAGPHNPVPTPPVNQGYFYTVQPGDTLYSIARHHGITVAAIKSINGLTSNLIFPGRQLNLDPHIDDGSMPTPPPSRQSQTHIVVAGDTLYSIAKKYGTTVYALQRDNQLSGTTIDIGQSLQIIQ